MSARARESGSKTDSPVRCSRIRFLETQIEEFLGLSDAALELEQASASVAALGKACELRAELDKLRAFEAERKKKRSPLEQVKAMRARADAAGSHVAAQGYLKLELELQAEEEAKRVEAERQRLVGLGLDERLVRLVELLQGLPVEVREQVRVAVFAEVH